MKIAVCIKQVPDITAPLHIQNGALVFDTNRMVLNAYDASAVEAALVLLENREGSIHLFLLGPDRAKETIRKALAMGAHEATHLLVPDDAALDAHLSASLLAEQLKQHTFDILLCGKQSQDTDAGLTGTMLAEHLALPYATNAVGLTLEDDLVVATRQGDAGQEIMALETPCLVTCSNDMNNPRIPSIKGIMQSKRKPVQTIPVTPEAAPSTQVMGYEPLPERTPGVQWEGEPLELARRLVHHLNDEARVLS